MTRPAWFVHILKKLFRRFKYLTFFIRLPIIHKIVENHVKTDRIVYLTEDKLIPVNFEIEKQADMILPSKVLEHFIEKSKYRWIMNFCICRVGHKCKKHSRSLGCLFMGDAVLNISPFLGRLASKEEALEHLEKCRKDGLIQIIGRQKVDAFWLNISPEEKLLTVCNCCDCCCLANLLRDLTPKIRSSAIRMPGMKMVVGEDCVGCGKCLEGPCIFNAIKIVNNQAVISDECRCCGRCAQKCPRNNIKVVVNDMQTVEKAIREIESLVDVT